MARRRSSAPEHHAQNPLAIDHERVLWQLRKYALFDVLSEWGEKEGPRWRGGHRGQGMGSGGRIRTCDLWVMSPTSCHCSTPRHKEGGGNPWGVPATASPPTGSPPQYSPALPQVTTGFGMGPGGSTALAATDTPQRFPAWSSLHADGLRPASGCASAPDRPRRAHHEVPTGAHRRHPGRGRSPLAHQHGSAPVRCRLSTSRLSTRSSPGGLSGLLPGVSRLGAGFPLRCLQRFAFPHVATQRCRWYDNWLTSGASIPVLSY